MTHTESKIQIAAVRWFRVQYPELALNLISIPNGYKTTPMQARIAKAEGLVAGAADLFLFYPAHGYHGLAIEMKTEKGRQRDTQKAWQNAVERHGYKYVVCRSFDEFMAVIKAYVQFFP